MTEMYEATWPIEDEDRRMSELIEEAVTDLAAMVAKDGLVIEEVTGHRFAHSFGVKRPTLTLTCRVRRLSLNSEGWAA